MNQTTFTITRHRGPPRITQRPMVLTIDHVAFIMDTPWQRLRRAWRLIRGEV